ncbi:hypothetical protein [Kutzneria buriramensis]|uniref:Uncharacterized protein n=1 Tax=Kutzneria buriramensis TaxID=1045776 RepID=A0A3E0GY41_9PSEU|nr:hypothetical protein [Kutzneria buriramensis]REH31030.1 hypothetical protein BCF44_12253 [Kutzneria buriramensis]
MPAHHGVTATPDPELDELRARAAEGERRLADLMAQLLAKPSVLDRGLLGELAAELDHNAWIAVDAAEQVARRQPPPAAVRESRRAA